jgi:hypothetical protein
MEKEGGGDGILLILNQFFFPTEGGDYEGV